MSKRGHSYYHSYPTESVEGKIVGNVATEAVTIGSDECFQHPTGVELGVIAG
jgi:hypothetical protein